MAMNDSFNREIDYLRISVTDRCNLRCLYCMPEDGVVRLRHEEILRYEEIIRIAGIAAGIGVRKIRLTGGEPLVRPGIAGLVEKLSAIDGIEDISLTTNGILLADQAEKLAAAGLRRVNISLDTLDPDKYRRITRNGDLERVFEGLEAAISAGLMPVKINVVAIRGFNDDEILPMAEWALENKLNLRFIEFMPVNDSAFPFGSGFYSSDEIREVLFGRFPDLGPDIIEGSGPAVCWSIPGVCGSLGVIEAVSHQFCGSCNRLRLTSDGKLRPCLFSERELDLVSVLRAGGPDDEPVKNVLREAIRLKPESHNGFQSGAEEGRYMHEIGG